MLINVIVFRVCFENVFGVPGYMTSGNLFRTLLEIASPSGYFFIFSAVDTMIITFF